MVLLESIHKPVFFILSYEQSSLDIMWLTNTQLCITAWRNKDTWFLILFLQLQNEKHAFMLSPLSSDTSKCDKTFLRQRQ